MQRSACHPIQLSLVSFSLSLPLSDRNLSSSSSDEESTTILASSSSSSVVVLVAPEHCAAQTQPIYPSTHPSTHPSAHPSTEAGQASITPHHSSLRLVSSSVAPICPHARAVYIGFFFFGMVCVVVLWVVTSCLPACPVLSCPFFSFSFSFPLLLRSRPSMASCLSAKWPARPWMGWLLIQRRGGR